MVAFIFCHNIFACPCMGFNWNLPYWALQDRALHSWASLNLALMGGSYLTLLDHSLLHLFGILGLIGAFLAADSSTNVQMLLFVCLLL